MVSVFVVNTSVESVKASVDIYIYTNSSKSNQFSVSSLDDLSYNTKK